MKLRITLMLIVTLAIPSFAQYAAVGKVKNSKHDLSSSSSALVKSSDLDQVCGFCHVAHISPTAPSGNQTPLWNHKLGATITGAYGGTGTFVSLNTDIQALGAATWGTANSSHLCMSCHDGTVAVNSIYKFTSTITPVSGHSDSSGKLLATNTANLGTDLSGTHPVNFTYQGAAWLSAQTHVAVPSNFQVGPAKLPLDAAGKLQCATCHSVHDATNTYFLRDSINGSQICLDCHLST